MTSRKLNQSGQEIDLEAMKVGEEAYFYKPPTIQDVERLGRKAKHINHYVGPGTIEEIIGDRSFVILTSFSFSFGVFEFWRYVWGDNFFVESIADVEEFPLGVVGTQEMGKTSAILRLRIGKTNRPGECSKVCNSISRA